MTSTPCAKAPEHADRDALRATDLYRFYRAGEEETLALRGVTLQVRRGETVAVIGPSGSGKSTLLACLAGLDEPDGGVVHIGGERISHRPEAERSRVRARRIGVLLQSGNLVAHLDVSANIRLARTAAPGGSKQSVASLLDRVGLGHRARALPQELAGGELARAGLAVALANDPDILLADEPTGELDGATEQRILRLLRARADAGGGVLVVTHSPEAVKIADRVITLRDGRIPS
ncbi:ABC transporter ATP-binding protein [Streptomyces longhuiensis]|uniref:ABC transporter ATP-binding protein n=1 Tax=Streptomyces TaxID=1883 RepID=UPI001D0ACA8C|nr:ABC transporter ATP-binding protein [Streptomyces longhuiensis]UDL97137.1 ABC transporter ATP-binding protein [Streptomyces longhuiensis]